MKADEKRCPRCAEPIKKAALVCKHCGHEFSAKDVAKQRETDSKATLGGIGCLVIIALVVLAMCSVGGKSNHATRSDTSGAVAESEDSKIASYQVAAKATMRQLLRDPGSAKYQDVRAYPLGNGYVFCGQVNSKNGFGGYTGFQRFVAGPGIATTEDMISDFSTLWSQTCNGVGREVWF